MAVSIEEIKKLKELTGLGLSDAKKALLEADGDFDKALEALRKKGLTKAEKKGDREAREGLVEAYVHGGRIGVIVEVNCETDFVARTEDFKQFAHQIKEGKPADIAAKIVDGQVKKYFAEKVLLSQNYIMDDSKTVEQFRKEAIAKLGENIVIRQFSRIELGVTE